MAVLTHVDYKYGNLADAEKVGKICREYDVPFMLNCAYTAGRMPVSGKRLNADFIVASGHKSMAACGPVGVLATTEEYAKVVFRTSKVKGDWSGRSFPMKEVELLGCTARGAPLVTLMASFPYVVERVKRWGEEVKKARYLVEQLEQIEGVRQLGIKPKQHDLIYFETPCFYEISKKHKKRGFFLYHELKKRGIVGVQPGITKYVKLSTYGLTWEQVEKVASVFLEIAREHRVNVG